MMKTTYEIKERIIEALAHPEAEEGLFFKNFYQLHEEDERRPVPGTEVEILDALKELISEGRVGLNENDEEVVFFLKKS